MSLEDERRQITIFKGDIVLSRTQKKLIIKAIDLAMSQIRDRLDQRLMSPQEASILMFDLGQLSNHFASEK